MFDQTEEPPVHDQFDVSLEDGDLLGEVELTTNLIIAASETAVSVSPPPPMPLIPWWRWP